jgi:hypothetical protein
MQQAEVKLADRYPEGSLPDQDEAIQRLERAIARLDEMSEEARRKLQSLPFDAQARAQELTRVETERLADEMKAAEQGGKTSAEPTPGRQDLEQAVPKQRAAAGSLTERKPAAAKQDQQDALDELNEAKRQLEDALAQLRQELQDEVLRSLEERLTAMLAKQREISGRTKVTERLRAESTSDGQVPAAVRERCLEEAKGETELAGEAREAVRLLGEEGSTAVFPELLAELEGDLGRIAERLSRSDTGPPTQAMQKAAEDLIALLVDALKRQIEDNEGSGCSGGGEPPLIRLSAEVKLIQAMQKAVNRRTAAFDGAVPAPARAAAEARDEAAEIARKQARVEDLTRKLAVKLEKAEEENPGGERR